LDLRRAVSGAIGVVGGLVDLVVGLSIFGGNSMEMGSMMNGALMLSYALLALGAIVLLTGLYVMFSMMSPHGSVVGRLMLVYGTVMLVLGVGMIERLFNLMMQGSILSGVTMILLGLAMLYSGFDMTKSMKTKKT
jgi:hypothetical protein